MLCIVARNDSERGEKKLGHFRSLDKIVINVQGGIILK